MWEEIKKRLVFLELTQLTDIPNKGDLKRARNQLLKKWHPDKIDPEDANLKEKANQKAKEINVSYDFLSKQDLQRYSSEYKNSFLKTNTSASSNFSWKYQQDPDPTHYRDIPEKGFPDPNVYEVFLQSKYATSAGYNEVEKSMYIRFIWGDVCKYSNVPEWVFEELIDSFSKYSFIKNNVTNKFT